MENTLEYRRVYKPNLDRVLEKALFVSRRYGYSALLEVLSLDWPTLMQLYSHHNGDNVLKLKEMIGSHGKTSEEVYEDLKQTRQDLLKLIRSWLEQEYKEDKIDITTISWDQEAEWTTEILKRIHDEISKKKK